VNFAPAPQEGRGRRVATFNVRAAIGPGPFPDRWWRRCDAGRLERIAGVIRDLRADVVALQEVALLALDGEVVDQAAELARMTGMAHRYGAVRTWIAEESDGVHGAGLFGNALLAHGNVTGAQVLALPRAPDGALIEAEDADHRWAGVTWADAPPTTREPRCAVVATLDGLRIASAHLSHVGPGERLLQAAALAGAGIDLVLGDLNSALDAPAMAPFAGWTDAFAAAGIPIGDDRRRSTDDGWPIDQVLLRPHLAWQVAHCEVIRTAGDASDHYPVVADLRHSSHAATDATGYPPAQ
jgi:endonuclease/exonuclease/phosphatase family metal-dependent hydrolase